MRTCQRCGEEFPATAEFFDRDITKKGGLKSWCKICRSESSRVHYTRWNKPQEKHKNFCKVCGTSIGFDGRQKHCKEHTVTREICQKYCKSCGVSIGFDGRKKFCDSCWKARRSKQQKDYLHRTKVGKAEDCFQPTDYCYMDLVEAMIEHCWEPECETCILDGYCMKRTWVQDEVCAVS